MRRVAIVGAGVAGLATAHALRTLPLEVIVFEKSRGYGGRVASRSRYRSRYDHGANYFTAPSERVEHLITAHLPTDGLIEIGRPVWHFDGEGTLSGPDPELEEAPKWTYRQGISRLGKLLAAYSRAEVRTKTRISRILYKDARWTLRSEDGASAGPFDAVVLTPPAPQTAALLADADIGGERVRRLRRAVAAVDYAPQFSFVFAFDRPLSRPGGFYGLKNADHDHPLSWISFEHDKPGHVRAGRSMLVVQTAPHWTANRLEQEPDRFVPEVKAMAEDVLVCDLRHPEWYDVQRWRYARPREAVDADIVDAGRPLGLFLAGDSVCGTGRVGAALETGLDVALKIREAL